MHLCQRGLAPLEKVDLAPLDPHRRIPRAPGHVMRSDWIMAGSSSAWVLIRTSIPGGGRLRSHELAHHQMLLSSDTAAG